jgi:N-glycosylase/DNA lyase
MTSGLTPDLWDLYKRSKQDIRSRLHDFASIPREQYFYEFCFCLCTPQSKAIHADLVVQELSRLDYLHKPFDATELLRSSSHYIRFHNTKARRLRLLQQKWSDIDAYLDRRLDPLLVRQNIVRSVDGFGLKESSHALRNIGFRGLAIIDRHLLRMLVACNVLAAIPASISRLEYLSIEATFKRFADEVDVDMDELDLLFWSSVTGRIVK